jgi:UTP--glucose-1-phosphate uridylyltransferase
LLADDVVKGTISPISQLMAGYQATGKTQLSVMDVPAQDVSKYGILVPGKAPGSVAGLVEKPGMGEAPSQLASIGRYVLEPEIFDILMGLAPGAGGEIQLADAIDQRAKEGHVTSIALAGRRYDCGSKFGYLEAIVDYALDHEEYRERFAGLLAHRVMG